MKKIFTIIAIAHLLISYGQSNIQNSNKGFPEIVRPSPTVAQLMKIEESQLDNFTGQPQIALPLASVKSGKLLVDLSLSYNSSGIRVSEASGWVGKGWVLNVGGVISRSVIDLPDEINTSIHKGANYNNYHNFFNFAVNSEERNEFSYDAQWRRDIDLDSKNDVYQFNFMGKTGRFVFTKTGNILRPEIIGDNANFKIEPIYTNTSSPFYPVEINEFVVTDDLGYKYYFEDKERTEKKDITFVYMQAGCDNMVAPQEYTQIGKFITAWHLSKVKDENGQQLFNISYTDVFEKPRAPMSQTNYFAKNLQTVFSGSFPQCTPHMRCALKPQTTTNQPLRNVDSKKINRITFRDSSYIQFHISNSHPDYISQRGAYLTSIAMHDGQNPLPAKTFDFQYSGRLFLNRVRINNSENDSYSFDYFEKELYPEYSDFDPSNRDIFGYPNISGFKEHMCTGVLTKITYPTKGVKEFKWEPNTYSYKGDKLLSFQEIFTNPDNYTTSGESLFDPFMNDANNTTRPYHIMQVNFEQDAFIYSSTSSTGYFDFVIPNSVEIRPIVSYTDHSLDAGRPLLSYPIGINEFINKPIHLKPGLYKIYFHSLNLGISNTDKIKGNIDIVLKNPTQTLNWFLYGGGIRIKSINDSDRNIEQIVKVFQYNFENPGTVPNDLPPYFASLNGSYILNFSSGSLDGIDNLIKKSTVSVMPIYNVPYYNTPFSGSEVVYDVEERQSEIDAQLAKGSFIGYKNVFEYFYPNDYSLGINQYKSKIKYSYDSAIDFPSTIISYSSLPIRSVDHKHGNARKIEYFKPRGELVVSEDFKYNYDDNEIRTLVAKNFYAVGNEIHFSGLCQQIRELFPTYQMLKRNRIAAFQYSIDCAGGPSVLAQSFLDVDKSSCIANLSQFYMQFEDYKQKVQVTEHVKKEYFDTGIVVHKDNYIYRNNFMRLFSKTSLLANGETTETKYYYPQDSEMSSAPLRSELIAKNIISSTLKTETYKNGELISVNETQYGNFTPVDESNPQSGLNILPKYVLAGKGNVIERKITFDSYDDQSNILQYTAENGVPTSFIWGFNKSQPTVKLDNMAYANIPANLRNLVHTASNANPYNEPALLAALDALRTSPALANAMVTSYTYRPLFGISTMTDPKGYRTSYHYDSFGRLELVKDNEDNVLSENKYHYRTQN